MGQLSQRRLWESCLTTHKLLNGSAVNTALAPAKFKQTLRNLITVMIQDKFNIWIPVKYAGN